MVNGEWWCSLLPIDSDNYSNSDSETTVVHSFDDCSLPIFLLLYSCFLISSDAICVICV